MIHWYSCDDIFIYIYSHNSLFPSFLPFLYKNNGDIIDFDSTIVSIFSTNSTRVTWTFVEFTYKLHNTKIVAVDLLKMQPLKWLSAAWWCSYWWWRLWGTQKLHKSTFEHLKAKKYSTESKKCIFVVPIMMRSHLPVPSPPLVCTSVNWTGIQLSEMRQQRDTIELMYYCYSALVHIKII